ncbi:MAG: twitching motility protein PilT [Agrobacterium sp. SCN 61-19]|nr:MAG: twitching motility protein PilT [Agrobacterium sp. SCN 61-19]
MPFVVDASVVGAWLLPDEENAHADETLARMADDDAFAPDLLIHEIRSILLNAERRGRISSDLIHSGLARLRALPLKFSGPGDDSEVVRLSRKYQLSSYDAAYLALAVLDQLELATLDRKLAAAARKESLKVLGPLAYGD